MISGFLQKNSFHCYIETQFSALYINNRFIKLHPVTACDRNWRLVKPKLIWPVSVYEKKNTEITHWMEIYFFSAPAITHEKNTEI